MAMLSRSTTSAISAPGSPKVLQRFQNCIASILWPSLGNGSAINVQRKSTQMDAIDCFTNELMEKKSRKWEEFREQLLKKTESKFNTVKSSSSVSTPSKSSFSQSVGLMSKGVVSDIQALRSPEIALDIRRLSQAQLDNLIMSTLEIKNKLDFLYLVRQSIEWQKLPSDEVLVSCLKYLGTLAKVQQIESFAEICVKQGNPLTTKYADLAPFKAIAQWRSGGADVALLTLHRGYESSCKSEEGRRLIRAAFRTITEETLAQKSEAVLVALMDVARAIYSEYNDIFVIASVWKQCFVSDWFCDQKSAADLFEYYPDLQQLVSKKSSSLSNSFLSRNNVDAIHRLIEVFLQYKQRRACANCLSLLFNYQYRRKDLRACAEIIKSCSELEMPLNEIQNEQFLKLFLDQSNTNENNTTRPKSPKTTTLNEFQYKF